ncbi:MAG TPA: addiction module protein [Kiritimatiellia bacterium]|nr:addiction module protein [Kiritimatiellia bacterium]HMO98904.1 addiction module protein [Kiritimatiellia bacterium]
MSTTVADEILDRALKQSDTDRARIAEALIASLDAPPDQDTEKTWQAEIDKRLREIDSGTVQCIPWEEVRDRLYRNANVQR